MGFVQRNSLVLAERDRFGPPAFAPEARGGIEAIAQPRLPQARLAFRIPRTLWFGIALLAIATGIRLLTVLPSDSRLSSSSGVWTALAMDYANGTLYRPLISPAGYGGTRYFPLHILVHGTLIQAGLSPLVAGYLITGVCSIALLAGVYRLLRQLEAEPAWAFIGMVLALAPAAMQESITTIRGDLLPAALNIWGLVFAAKALESRLWRWIFVASIFFALAAVAKISTLFGAAAAFSALLLARQPTRAAVLAVVSAAVAFAILAIVNARSDGRFLENLLNCGAGGGGLSWLHQAPFRLAWVASDRDPVGLILLALAAAAFIVTAGESWKELPGLALIWTALATALLFLTPGIDSNHLIDLHIIAGVFIIRQLATRRIELPLASGAIAIIFIFAALYAGLAMRAEDRKPLREDYLTAVGQGADPSKTILSDDPMAAVFAGQSPVVLDDFMFTALRKKNAQFASDLCQHLGRQEFGVVVLSRPLDSPEIRQTFGDEFAQSLLAGYDKASGSATLFVYHPRLATQAGAGGND